MNNFNESITVNIISSQDMTTNEMLNLKGFYRLSDVCEFLIFKPHQLRNQAAKHDNPREAMGVFWHDQARMYLVEMPTFSKWLKELWLNSTT